MISPQYFLSKISSSLTNPACLVQYWIIRKSDWMRWPKKRMALVTRKGQNTRQLFNPCNAKFHDIVNRFLKQGYCFILPYDSELWCLVICESFSREGWKKRLNFEGVPCWTLRGFSVGFYGYCGIVAAGGGGQIVFFFKLAIDEITVCLLVTWKYTLLFSLIKKIQPN